MLWGSVLKIKRERLMVNEDLEWLLDRGYSIDRLAEFSELTSEFFEHGLDENKCRQIAVQRMEMIPG